MYMFNYKNAIQMKAVCYIYLYLYNICKCIHLHYFSGLGIIYTLFRVAAALLFVFEFRSRYTSTWINGICYIATPFAERQCSESIAVCIVLLLCHSLPLHLRSEPFVIEPDALDDTLHVERALLRELNKDAHLFGHLVRI